MDGLTQKQETFCLKYFEIGNASEAALFAGYSKKSIRNIASTNLTKPNIQERLQQLRSKAEDATVAAVLERKQVLTEIIRAKQTDFMTCSADGVWMHDIGEETLNTVAIKKVRTTTMPFGPNDSPLKIILTEVELEDKQKAIDILNKMERIYEAGTSVVIDNRTLNITVESPKAQELVERLVAGEGRAPGGDGHKDIVEGESDGPDGD